VDLIHPHAKHDVADAMREASVHGTRVRVVGGRTHMDRARPTEVDAELWTTMLDEVASYEPAEMIAVVEAGMRVGDLQAMLAEGGQEWPVDAPHDATVGGVISAGVSSFRRLRVGHVRDTVVEIELITGDGRAIRSGARTVKNVTGYDIHRLATGSLGTLGVIVQAALKLRPLPELRRTITVEGDGLAIGRRLLGAVYSPAAVLARPDGVTLWLEGWAAEVEEQTDAARSVESSLEIVEDPAAFDPLGGQASVVVEAAVPPSRIGEVVEDRRAWTALLGVGIVWFRLENDEVPGREGLRKAAAAAGGIATVIKGRNALDPAEVPAPEIHQRLKAAFDPAGILPMLY
jgi:glycolate oxidase FAD binding subunit